MKIFGYEFRKFESTNTTIEAIETWIVEWESLHKNCLSNGEPNTQKQAFINKDGAKLFAKELNDCRKLLGDKGFSAKVYMQKSPTNKV